MNNNNTTSKDDMPFLDHVAELRKHLLRALVGVVIGAILAAVFWQQILDFIMAPLKSNFITYTVFNKIGNFTGYGDLFPKNFDIQTELTNLEFGGQFTAIIGVVLVAGLIIALPYVVYEIFQFIKPGLTPMERKYSNLTMFFTVMFFLFGVGFSYFFIMPLSVHFMYFFQPFGVENNWKLLSYISVFVQTTLSTGVVFLLPIFVYFLAKIDLVTPNFMKTYRKHAFVVVLTIAAIITPADILSMVIASIPLLLLYELSILIVKWVYKNKERTLTENNV
ncbi:twin-arginine translocase subunit TatC [Ornithobacterium rhinotracheale]|uniref:twin-arginine translocase subunit TatC n=1 Tax=Ornithobacterium rhinotracheale TaxID=28251 RepID=UPI001FB99BB7|nr:twin-arginine translocase subunit TatC [Ornithobacterium rhinotracheale]MRJ08682.1 twin-arginine translocase subunit TatC [Ornithobacterium rhinotracheale]UOH76872.1 twin-arginine translocase subunit TatC [Ornithobacterium rhinotracheale]